MSPHAATFSEALAALDTLMGYHDRWMRTEFRREGRTAIFYHRCGNPQALVRLVQRSDELYSDEIVLRLPEHLRWKGQMGGTVLWCRVEGTDQLRRARAFRPLPTLVLQEGSSSRRLLMWGLRTWIPYFDVEDRNRKIAYRLRAVQRFGSPENLVVPAPGTCLRVGRTRPVPIVVSRLTTDVYEPDQITRLLKEPPPVRMPWEVAA